MRRQGDALVIGSLDREALAELSQRWDEVVGGLRPGLVVLDWSGQEAIRGEHLETLMQLRDRADDGGFPLALVGVTFYVEQLLSVLELGDQIPPRFASVEEAAESAGVSLEGPAAAQTAPTVRLERRVDPDLLAVDFDDFRAPVPVVTEETFEIDLEGEMAYADTDKFSALDVSAAPGFPSRTTEVLPAFEGLDDELEEARAGVGALLAVDFDDFQAPSHAGGDTPPEGVEVARDESGEFQLEFDDEEVEVGSSGSFFERPAASAQLPFPAASNAGYSPVGKLSDEPPKEPAPLPETKVFDPTRLSEPALQSLETQELSVPDMSLLETARMDASPSLPAAPVAPAFAEVTSGAASEEQDEEVLDEEVFDEEVLDEEVFDGEGFDGEGFDGEDVDGEDVVDAFDEIEEPAVEEPLGIVGPGFSEGAGGFGSDLMSGDGEQSVMITPGPSFGMAGGYDASLLSGDGEETMMVSFSAADVARHLQNLDAAAVELSASREPVESDSQRLLRVERERIEAEKRELEEERARLQLEAERARLEDERRKIEAERRALEEDVKRRREEAEERARLEAELEEARKADRAKAMEATRAAERKKLEEELRAAQEAERKRLEEELAALRERERKKLEEEMRAAQELERKKLEEELRAAKEAERKRFEEELRASQEAERERLRQEIAAAREAEEREAKEREAAARAKAEEERRAREREREAAEEVEREAAAREAAERDEAEREASKGKGKAKFNDWMKQVMEDPGKLKPKRSATEEVKAKEAIVAKRAREAAKLEELGGFIADFGIASPLHVRILGLLKRANGKPEAKPELAKVVDASPAAVGEILDHFVSKRIVKRVRAPRIRGGYGYSFSASPKTRNMVVTLLRVSKDGREWPVAGDA